jgi:hypothetical protein
MGRAGVLQHFALGHCGLLGARGIVCSLFFSLFLLVEEAYLYTARSKGARTAAASTPIGPRARL